MLRRSGRSLAVAGVLVLAMVPSAALAQSDYSDKPLSLRLAPAFIRFTEVSTMGGETVANPFSSAINPASADWMSASYDFHVVAAPYYSLIQLDEGTRINVFGEALSLNLGSLGTLQPALSQVRSNRATTRQGLDFDYSVDSFQVQWAKRVDQWALGANFNFARAEIVQGGQVGPASVHAVGDAESYRFRFGGLYEPAPKWLVGGIFEYGFQPFRSNTLTRIPLPPPLPPMVMTGHEEGIQQQFILRPGVSYEYAPGSRVFADYQYGIFFNKDGRLDDGRLSVGVDHQLYQWLYVRTSAGIDNRGNASWTAGASLHFAKWGSLDAGYQYNTLPELRPEFGRSQSLQLTLSIRF